MATEVPSSAARIAGDAVADTVWYRFFVDQLRVVKGKYDTADISAGWQTALAQTPTGTYTPTITDVTNVDSSSPDVTAYIRIGGMVVVFGRVDVNCTLAAATLSEIGISLPIASNFANLSEAGGVGYTGLLSVGAQILGDVTNNRFRMRWESQSTGNVTFGFIAGYQII